MFYFSLSSSLLQAPGSRLPSAEDITEYILLTGDQESVVNLIEGLVNNGKVRIRKQLGEKMFTIV